MNVVEKYKLKFQYNKISVIRSFSKKELMDELMKRDEIKTIGVPNERMWFITVEDNRGSGEQVEGCGKATILVVKMP